MSPKKQLNPKQRNDSRPRGPVVVPSTAETGQARDHPLAAGFPLDPLSHSPARDHHERTTPWRTRHDR